MELDYHSIEKNLIFPIKEVKAIKLIKEMSSLLTKKRDELDGYSDSEEFVSAYSLFYMPTNYPKLSFVFSELPEEYKETLKGAHLVDFGCGPGTFSLAFMQELKQSLSRIWLIDKSETMLKQAGQFLNRNYPDFNNINSMLEVKATSSEDNKILFFGNSLNEIKFEKAKKVIELIKPRHIFIIEPGTKESFEEVSKLREFIGTQGFNVIYPCPNLNQCPARSIEGEWCHQVLRKTHDPSIERLSQLVNLDRKVQPFCGHVYSLENVVQKKSALFFQYLNETKYSFMWRVCLEKEENKLVTFEIMKKNLSKKEQKEFKKLSVGLKFEYEILKEINSDHFRVKVVL